MPETILLMGLPNVGKSALFSKLTGLHIMVSNYVGTTIDFTEGQMQIDKKTYRLIDVPGTYGLEATNPAEQVAVDMLKARPKAVICVLDAINLESSLHLLLEVLRYRLPTVAVINRVDLAKKRGLDIDYTKLAQELSIPILPTVATEGTGLVELRQIIANLAEYEDKSTDESKTVEDEGDGAWKYAEDLTKGCVRTSSRETKTKAAFLIKPWPGIPIAAMVISLMFGFVIGVGMGLRKFILLPFFRGLVFPAIENGVNAIVQEEWLRNILIGEYGFLIKGIEWPIALVLPYVISFYIALSTLEDCGYLPRLAVLLDGVLRKIGLGGSSIIPWLLGYGCGIPAIMATRSLAQKKQRIMLAAMICFAVPCVSQLGAFISLLSQRSMLAVGMLFLFSVLAVFVVGAVTNRIIPGTAPCTLMEVPELLCPKPRILFKKILMRIRHFFFDGVLPMLVAVMVASLLFELGVLNALGSLLAPFISGWLNLPEMAVVPLILGIVRRELAVLPLIDMDLTTLQFITGSVVALFYVPCIAMVATLAKEFSIRFSLLILFLTTFTALFLGGLVAQIGLLFS